MRKPSILLISWLSIILPLCAQGQSSQTITQAVISKGHAHNDYQHPRPLMQALELGYRSIEVDIWLHEGKLIVSHDSVDLDKKPTLQALYFDSLKAIYKVAFRYKLKESEPLVLMIDIKSEPEATYTVLKNVLAQYDPILTRYAGDRAVKNLVAINISGRTPNYSLSMQTERYVTLDVSAEQANKEPSDFAIRRVSSNYKHFFKWDGKGIMPETELMQLQVMVSNAHQQKREIRFWGAPDTPELWKTFLDAGVDWINTDKLGEFQQFYIQYQTTKR